MMCLFSVRWPLRASNAVIYLFGLPGWHRIGLACRRLEHAVTALSQAGAEVVVPRYQMLPGLREAMFILPSGLVIQPVEQTLWKMLPFTVGKGLIARLTDRPIRFRGDLMKGKERCRV
jgi:hypothetical protein